MTRDPAAWLIAAMLWMLMTIVIVSVASGLVTVVWIAISGALTATALRKAE